MSQSPADESPLPAGVLEVVDLGIVRSSPELGELFKALSAAQGEMTDPPKDKRATVKMKNGGEYGYKYSDLADLLKIVRPIFARHGLALLQFPSNPRRGSVTIVTRLGHASGQWIESELTMAVEDDRPQTLGSMITYGRRYAAGAIAGISPDEDEDGQIGQAAANDRDKPPPPRSRQQMKDDRHQEAGRRQEADRAAGAQAAARAAAEAGNPKPTKASIYDDANPAMQKRLANILKSQKVDELLWEAVGKKLDGRPSTDLKAVLAEITEAAP